MKTSHRIVLAFFCTVFLPCFFFGCAKTDHVDVSAQTKALSSADRDARVNACIELAKAGPKAASAVTALIPILKDQDAEIRRLAAYALMEIGPDAKAAIAGVREQLNDPDRQVALQAVNTLRAIDPTAKDLKPPPNVTTGVKP